MNKYLYNLIFQLQSQPNKGDKAYSIPFYILYNYLLCGRGNMSRDCGGKIFVLFSQKLEETLRADFRLLPVAQLCIL